MPFSLTTKSMCVLYALLILLSITSAAPGQGYVDQLSRGDSDVTLRRPPLSAGYEPLRRDNPADALESRLRSIGNGESAVALRPQPMSVRHANFVSSDRNAGLYSAEQSQTQSRQSLGRLNAEEHFQSFIERESTEPAEEKASATDVITRIGVNLIFVLALAVGGILFFKQFQKGRSGVASDAPAGLSGLKIDQVLQVTRGVSLYLVDSMASKILVAVDAGGIKSVNVLPSRFEDELEEPEAFSRQHESETSRAGGNVSGRQASRRSINKTSTSEIDDNLIKLLLSKSREAA